MTERHSAGTLPAHPADDKLTTEEAAPVTGVAAQTLRKWRHYGTGPKSYRLGRRIYYDRADLDAWLAAQKSRTERGGTA